MLKMFEKKRTPISDPTKVRGVLAFKAHRLCVSLHSSLQCKKEEEEARETNGREDEEGGEIDRLFKVDNLVFRYKFVNFRANNDPVSPNRFAQPASERRRKTLKRLEDLGLKVKAKIWP